MIRSSSLTLKFATLTKLNTLNQVFNEYTNVVNQFITEFHQSEVLPRFSKNKTETWISVQLQQVAGKQALEIVKSTRKKDLDIRFKIGLDFIIYYKL